MSRLYSNSLIKLPFYYFDRILQAPTSNNLLIQKLQQNSQFYNYNISKTMSVVVRCDRPRGKKELKQIIERFDDFFMHRRATEYYFCIILNDLIAPRSKKIPFFQNNI